MKDLEAAITAVQQRAQVLTSVEAELGATPPRWIFEAPTFAAGAGEYVLIHRKDWDQFKFDLRMAFGPTTPDVVGCTNADQPPGGVICRHGNIVGGCMACALQPELTVDLPTAKGG